MISVPCFLTDISGESVCCKYLAKACKLASDTSILCLKIMKIIDKKYLKFLNVFFYINSYLHKT